MLIKVVSITQNDAYRIRTENKGFVTVSSFRCLPQTTHCTCFYLVNSEFFCIISSSNKRYSRSYFVHDTDDTDDADVPNTSDQIFLFYNEDYYHGVNLDALPAVWGEISAPVEIKHSSNIYLYMQSNLGSNKHIPSWDGTCTCLSSYAQFYLPKYCRHFILKVTALCIVNLYALRFKCLCNNCNFCKTCKTYHTYQIYRIYFRVGATFEMIRTE